MIRPATTTVIDAYTVKCCIVFIFIRGNVVDDTFPLLGRPAFAVKFYLPNLNRM